MHFQCRPFSGRWGAEQHTYIQITLKPDRNRPNTQGNAPASPAVSDADRSEHRPLKHGSQQAQLATRTAPLDIKVAGRLKHKKGC